MVAISRDTPRRAARVVREDRLSMTILSDAEMRAIDAFGVANSAHDLALPSVIILGSDGRIAWRYVGKATKDRPTLATVLAATRATVRRGSAPSP